MRVTLEVLLNGRIKRFKRHSIKNWVKNSYWNPEILQDLKTQDIENGDILVTFTTTDSYKAAVLVRWSLTHNFRHDINKILIKMVPV